MVLKFKIPTILLADVNLFGPPEKRTLIVARGVIGAVAFTLYVTALSNISLGEANGRCMCGVLHTWIILGWRRLKMLTLRFSSFILHSTRVDGVDRAFLAGRATAAR